MKIQITSKTFQKLVTTVSHVGISVSDLEKAIDFYKEVFGFNLTKGLRSIAVNLSVCSAISKKS